MRIMVRTADSDFHAMITANGMEQAGAEVFSITFAGTHTLFAATQETAKYVVFAKVERDDLIDAVDDAIEAEFRRVLPHLFPPETTP